MERRLSLKRNYFFCGFYSTLFRVWTVDGSVSFWVNKTGSHSGEPIQQSRQKRREEQRHLFDYPTFVFKKLLLSKR